MAVLQKKLFCKNLVIVNKIFRFMILRAVHIFVRYKKVMNTTLLKLTDKFHEQIFSISTIFPVPEFY